MITIVFLSFYSEHHIRRHLSEIDIKFPIIVVDNSLNFEFKKEIEEKHKNVKVIIPKKNLGFAAGMNLGIKLSKTNYVFINSPDIIISNNSIEKLVSKISLIDNFALLGPTYLDESINKNYHELVNFNNYKNLNLKEVKWIDNNFIINKALSFNKEYIQVVEMAMLYPMPPNKLYDFYKDVIPKKPMWNKWVKSNVKWDEEELQSIATYFECGTREVKDFIDLLALDDKVIILNEIKGFEKKKKNGKRKK